MKINCLTDSKIKSFKPEKKSDGTFKKATYRDGDGLSLVVTPAGSKIWKLDFYCLKVRDSMTLGNYPALSLKDARQKRDEAKALAKEGVNPKHAAKEVQQERKKKAQERKRTFLAVAMEWYNSQIKDSSLSEKTKKPMLARLDKHIFPYIGNIPFSKIEFSDFVECIRRIEEQGRSDMPHRIATLVERICRYARTLQYSNDNKAADLTSILVKRPNPTRKHRAAITDEDGLKELLRRIDTYQHKGSESIIYALKIMPYVFLRSLELRGAEWTEIDWEKRLWTIPARRMKCRSAHEVPLSNQVYDLLKELRTINTGQYIFASGKKFITAEGLRRPLLVMGYDKEEMCIHGFRSIWSTRMRELGNYPEAVIEKQLAHKNGDKVAEAYDRATYIDLRRNALQFWADYLDDLRSV